jgi:flagellar biosynthesis/type III secretory pathway chaperone
MSDSQQQSLPPSAEELRQVIHIVEDLTAVMSREVELLRAMRVRDFGELQDHKLGLVQAYEKQTEHLRLNPAFVQALDPLVREELTDVMERMHAVMHENEQAINAARSANERVATAIVNAVQEHKAESSGYSAQGKAGGKSPARPPVSLQIDQHL